MVATRLDSATAAHPFAEIFPLVAGQPLYDLSDSIKANGLREPIVLLDGKILDGRGREIACLRAHVKPRYRQFGSLPTDGKDPLEFVYDLNYHRRHMGEGDRKLSAARYATAQRGRQPVKTTNAIPQEHRENTQNKSRNLRDLDPPTVPEAAEKFDVSEDDVERAKTVLSHGTESVQQALAADEITVGDAAKVAMESPAIQDAAVDAVLNGQAKSATGAAKAITGKAHSRKTREPKPPRAGKEVYPWQKFDGAFAKIAKAPDDVANAYGEKRSLEHRECIDALTTFRSVWTRWKKRLTKSEGEG
jgi:hypothetical protein